MAKTWTLKELAECSKTLKLSIPDSWRDNLFNGIRAGFIPGTVSSSQITFDGTNVGFDVSLPGGEPMKHKEFYDIIAAMVPKDDPHYRSMRQFADEVYKCYIDFVPGQPIDGVDSTWWGVRKINEGSYEVCDMRFIDRPPKCGYIATVVPKELALTVGKMFDVKLYPRSADRIECKSSGRVMYIVNNPGTPLLDLQSSDGYRDFARVLVDTLIRAAEKGMCVPLDPAVMYFSGDRVSVMTDPSLVKSLQPEGDVVECMRKQISSFLRLFRQRDLDKALIMEVALRNATLRNVKLLSLGPL